MSRSSTYRRTCSDAVSWRQDQANNATIYILRNMGPTGFLLKEEGESKNFKVFLGDPHSCTCPVYMKERDLCKHICWVLLKKYRVSRHNAISWQLGLVEREINEVLRGVAANQPTRSQPAASRKSVTSSVGGDQPEQGQAYVEQKSISEEDVCPICQEELLAKKLPVTYCKFGCGNSVHIKCMKVWADHQKTMSKTVIECPFCREDFGPIELLKREFVNSTSKDNMTDRLSHHHGVTCIRCHASPIVGRCYRCSVCADYNLCQDCFNLPVHQEHSFEFRQRPSQRWRPAQRSSGAALPEAVINNLMNRDITDGDYDMLLQLDNQAAQAPSTLSESTIRSFPVERVRAGCALMAPGQQCRICLRAYQEGQFVRRLPCRHRFHRECVDNWLLHQHSTCPVDGTIISNESVRQMREAQALRLRLQRPDNQHPGTCVPTSQSKGSLVLEIPGIGLAQQQRSGSLSNTLLPGRRERNTVLPVHDRNLATGLELNGNSYGSHVLNSREHSANSREGSSRSRSSPVLMSPHAALPPLGRRVSTESSGFMSVNNQQVEVDFLREGTLSAPNSGSHRSKPPTGLAHNSGEGRRGRLRGRAPLADTIRVRSRSRERSRSRDRLVNRPQEPQSIYLGHDPSTVAGFTSEFMTSQKVANRSRVNKFPLRRGLPQTSANPTCPSAGEADLSLAGSALSGLTLGDIVHS